MTYKAAAPEPLAEPLEPRLLLSADVEVLSSSMILPDLAATEVSLLPGGGEVSQTPTADAPVGDAFTWTGVFDIYVEAGLQAAIQPALDVYVDDLTAEGYTPAVQEFTGSAADLRAQLRSRYENAGLEGALLVGDLPTLTFRNDHDFDDKTVSFLHDLYFMDLDGDYVLYSDNTPDEHYDLDVDDDGILEGDVKPEIYVSRITTSPVTGMTGRSEAELIIDYFSRVHDYRTGVLSYENRGVLWSDDDWSWSGYKLGNLYDEKLVINDDDLTTRQSYLDTLELNYESMLEMIHSSATYHQVSGTGGGKVTSSEIHGLNPRIGFYNMWNCSSAKFTSSNNLISTYVYANDWGLNAVGSTKTGSMLSTSSFYNYQADGDSVGQAFARVMDLYARETADYSVSNVNWYYGMVMQGDPTLRPATMGDGVPMVVGQTPGGTVLGEQSSLTITFNKDMSPTSFSLAEDVTGFVGPGGQDLLTTLTGAAWDNPRNLTLSFLPVSTPGSYSLLLGPDITDIAGNPMNQDADETFGEPLDDAYTATFQIDNAAPQITLLSPTRPEVWMNTPGNRLLLEAAVSDDGFGGGSLSWGWSVLSAPDGETAGFDDAAAMVTAASFSGQGEYVLRLTADDGEKTSQQDVTVNIGNPTAATVDPDVLWYTFDEGSDSQATDATGQGRDGTISGATWASGHDGGALTFDGDDSVLDDDGEAYLNGLAGFTITSWIRSDRVGVDQGWLAGRDPSGGDDVLGIRYDKDGASGKGSNVIKIGINVSGNTVQFESSSNVQTTDWQFVAFTWSSGDALQLYLDGQLDIPTYTDGPAAGTLSDVTKLWVGRTPKGDDWHGAIDDVRIYSRALSADEIAALHAGGPSNVAAEVDAGADAQVSDVSAVLGGTAADEDALSYQWQLLDGPGSATFSDPADPEATVSVGAFGRYTLRLIADDGQVRTADDVTLILAPAGDANFDGVVSLADLSTLAAHWGSADAGWTEGDFNSDGGVTLADLSTLAGAWGTDLTGLVPAEPPAPQATAFATQPPATPQTVAPTPAMPAGQPPLVDALAEVGPARLGRPAPQPNAAARPSARRAAQPQITPVQAPGSAGAAPAGTASAAQAAWGTADRHAEEPVDLLVIRLETVPGPFERT